MGMYTVMTIRTINSRIKKYFSLSSRCILLLPCIIGVTHSAYAETVSGNGYVVEQVIAPIQGALSGNGYTVQGSAQGVGGVTSGGGYNLFGVFGAPATTTPPVVVPPVVSGGGSFGGGYYVFPPTATTTVIIATTSITASFLLAR